MYKPESTHSAYLSVINLESQQKIPQPSVLRTEQRAAPLPPQAGSFGKAGTLSPTRRSLQGWPRTGLGNLHPTLAAGCEAQAWDLTYVLIDAWEAATHRLVLFAEDWHGHRGEEHQALGF